MLLSGGPLYFIFHIQTRAHYFGQTLLAGGAAYRATGRGFVTRHSPFDEQYRFFASSHLYIGGEMVVGLLLLAHYTQAGQYAARTWALWLTAVSFVFAPFWFNPLGFSWTRVVEDYELWLRWISPRTLGGSAEQSWDHWYKEETRVYKSLSAGSRLLVSARAAVLLTLARGLAGDMLVRKAHLVQFFKLVAFVLVACFLQWLLNRGAAYCHYSCHRLTNLVLGLGTFATCVATVCVHGYFLSYAVALYYACAALALLGLLAPHIRCECRGFTLFELDGIALVKPLYRVHDFVFAHALFAVFIVLAALQIPDQMQTWLLFHNALSQGVVVEDILKQARKTQETGQDEAMRAELKDLRAMVHAQQDVIRGLQSSSRSGAPPAGFGAEPPGVRHHLGVPPRAGVSVQEPSSASNSRAAPSRSSSRRSCRRVCRARRAGRERGRARRGRCPGTGTSGLQEGRDLDAAACDVARRGIRGRGRAARAFEWEPRGCSNGRDLSATPSCACASRGAARRGEVAPRAASQWTL